MINVGYLEVGSRGQARVECNNKSFGTFGCDQVSGEIINDVHLPDLVDSPIPGCKLFVDDRVSNPPGWIMLNSADWKIG